MTHRCFQVSDKYTLKSELNNALKVLSASVTEVSLVTLHQFSLIISESVVEAVENKVQGKIILLHLFCEMRLWFLRSS